LIGFALVIAALVLSASVVLGIFAAFVLYRGGRWAIRRHRVQAARSAHRRAELLARADIQHRWVMAGDPRGTYGRYTPAA
jgi:hypothetical protein